jgi:outer membrane protein assembly factor BamD
MNRRVSNLLLWRPRLRSCAGARGPKGAGGFLALARGSIWTARSVRLGSLFLLAALLSGCAGEARRLPPGTPEPDKFLYERGTEALENRRWYTARQDFRLLIDSYPQSPLRADAKLGIGDTYLGEGTTEAYVLAINEFREFLTFFPTHPRADYAQYRLGVAFYDQMRRPERDQTETRGAVAEFETFLERYPNSPLRPDAETKLREARDRLSESEYLVGLFYFRSRWYPGAVHRFRHVLEEDPGYTSRDAVYFHLAESLVRMNQQAEALPYYERLVQEFEQSEYLDQARKRVNELKEQVVEAARQRL